jgi:hypothetical protein
VTSRARSGRLLRKVAASIGTVALAGGLMAFAHYGRFADPHDPFPHSVSSRN